MDLGGTWRVAAATEGRRRAFHESDHDDSGWATMPVPGHWAQQAAGDAASSLASEESVLYRHRFEGPSAPAATGSDRGAHSGAADDHRAEFRAEDRSEDRARRWWLRLEGLAQQGDVWLDGAYLGHTDGYFVPHELEVTEHLAARGEHLLAIEATCRSFGDPDNRTLLTGALQDPELCGADDLIVGGVWRPVRLRSTGRVAIRHARAVCAAVSTGEGRGRPRARLELRTVLDVPGGGQVDLRTRVSGAEHVHSHHCADGENRVEWTVDVDDPPLWWPHTLGDQPLCNLTVEASTGAEVHDRRQFRIGFRSVAMRRWVLYVNGERLFAKGTNLLPTRRLPGTATPSEVADDIRAARNAGLDLARPVAHIARPELYDAADELGVLIWQDLPIRGLMNRSVASEALRQAREAVDLLGHRPSVAVWCAHDQPFARPRRPGRTPAVVSRQAPSWNRDVLDRRLCRIFDRCDGSRPVVPHTGVPPRFPMLDGTTSELWFGLHGGRAADAGPLLARVPAMGRFVSAFGTPADDDQPDVVKTIIETLRRLKYRPTGGFLLHALADTAPADAAAASGAADSGGGPATPCGPSPPDTPGAATPRDPDTSDAATPRDPDTSDAATPRDPDTPGAATPRDPDTSDAATPRDPGGFGAATPRDPDTSDAATPRDPGGFGAATPRDPDTSDAATPRDLGGFGAATPRDPDTSDAATPRDLGGFGVLDGLHRPKPGWWALVEACRPLIVVADQLPESVRAGEHLDLAIHAINDARTGTGELQVRARMVGPGGAVVREQRWAGTIGADDCVLVGRLAATVPAVARAGPLVLELTLTGRGEPDDQPVTIATNRYTTTIAPADRTHNHQPPHHNHHT